MGKNCQPASLATRETAGNHATAWLFPNSTTFLVPWALSYWQIWLSVLLVSAGITDFVRSCRMWSKDGSRLLGIGSACCAARTAAFTPAGQRIGDIPTKRRGWRPRRWLAP